MTPITWATLFASLAALANSIYALVVAGRTSGSSQSRKLSQLSMRVEEQEASLEILAAQLRQARVRMNMASLREKRKDLAESASNGADSATDTQTLSASAESANDRWARETNLAIAKGEIRPWSR